MCFLGDTGYHLQKRNIVTAEDSFENRCIGEVVAQKVGV